jgi:electron transport complex protein RnfB
VIDIDAIDALLPQTQCTRCGYQGCRPYAAAIASGEANINQCPPGGTATIAALAEHLGRSPMPLNPVHGNEAPRTVALILEEHCIGCTKCLPACPVDAIVGANKRMHTVIAADCTGCELCIAPCPVDCIVMVPDTANQGAARPGFDEAERALLRHRYHAHLARSQQRAEAKSQLLALKREELKSATGATTLAEAIARAKARRSDQSSENSKR